MELKEGHKRTGIGLIPMDWDFDSFDSFIFQKRGGASIKPYEFVKKGVLVIPKGGIVRGGYLRILEKDVQYCSESFWNLHQNNSIDDSFLVVVLRDLVPSGPNLGLIVSVPDKGNYILAQGTYGFKTEPSKCHPSYLVQYSNTNQYRKLMQQNMVGSTQVFIRSSRLWDLKIPLPPLPEQKAIAQVLSDSDSLIQAIEQKLAKKRAIKQGAMQKLLTPKEDWEVKKLGDIGNVITGSTPSTKIEQYWNGNIPWVTPTDISNSLKNISTSEREITQNGLKATRKLPANTLLVTCIASIGKNAILRKKGACNQQINAIVPFEGNNVDFLYYLIENNKKLILSKAGITATLMVSKKVFSEIEFVIPNPKKQKEIATILSDMDAEIEQLEQKLSKYKMLKQGLMQNLLTGKIRLV